MSDVSLAHATAAGIRGTAADHRLTVALRRSEGDQSTQCDSTQVGQKALVIYNK